LKFILLKNSLSLFFDIFWHNGSGNYRIRVRLHFTFIQLRYIALSWWDKLFYVSTIIHFNVISPYMYVTYRCVNGTAAGFYRKIHTRCTFMGILRLCGNDILMFPPVFIARACILQLIKDLSISMLLYFSHIASQMMHLFVFHPHVTRLRYVYLMEYNGKYEMRDETASKVMYRISLTRNQ